MTEAKLYALTKALMTASWRPYRVETDTSIGLADVFYHRESGCGWLELKQAELLKDGDTIRVGHPLSVHQAEFLKLVDQSMKAHVLIGAHQNSVWKALVLIPGFRAWSLVERRSLKLSDVDAGAAGLVLRRPVFEDIRRHL